MAPMAPTQQKIHSSNTAWSIKNILYQTDSLFLIPVFLKIKDQL
jgi:hypothetical protein